MNPADSTNPTGSNCLSNRRGLTLLENMVALLIFTAALMGVASLQVFSMKVDGEARRAFHHSMAATEQLEAILALPFDDPLLRDPDDGYAPEVADHGPFKIAESRATIEWEVDDRFAVPDAKRVSVTIRTPGGGGRRKEFTYNYIKTRGFGK